MPSTEPTPRRCTGTTKKGKPCKAHPLKDRDVCMAHADAETRASVGFVPEAGKLGGRPRKPTAADFLREWFDDNEGDLLTALTGALTAQRAIVVATKDEAHVEFVTDHETRLKAFREALDRYFGRAKQQTEVTGPDGGPLRFAPPPDADMRSTRAGALLGEVAARELAATNGHSNGSNGHH